ncbi:MAG: sigma-70 family RNA polymerase sigma factor [Anaerolineales bacterium]
MQSQNAVTETGLIEQAQHGDRNAFGELVRRHYQGVVLVVTRMCGDTGLAEDAAQEAFMRAWVNLPSFQPKGCLRNWLYRIAINAALDVLRHKPEEALDDEQALKMPDQAADPETALINKERAVVLHQAVKSLPDAARAVLVLREYGGLSYREISGTLDVPIGTVMSRLNYARNRLREVLIGEMEITESKYA